LVDELKAGALIEAPGVAQHVIGPQHDPRVTGGSREAHRLVDQARAGAHSPRPRFDQQQPELSGLVVAADRQHAASRSAVDLGDPSPFPARVPLLGEVGNDAGDESLEALVPAVLLGVDRAVALDYPAQVAGPWLAQHGGARAGVA